MKGGNHLRTDPAEAQRAAPGPLFIVGAPRSGTSLVYKAISLHPAAAYISNWVRRYPEVPQLAALNRVSRLFPRLQRALWFGKDSNAYVYGSHRSWIARALPMPVEGEPLYASCGLSEDPRRPTAVPEPAQQAALRASFAAIRRYGNGQRVVSKRIANNHRIPLLHGAFPESRFVEVVRDGRAVAYSLSRVDWWPDSVVWWYGETPRQWEENGGDPWELCARSWVEEVRAIERGLSTVPPSSVLTVSYERLVREFGCVLRELALFASLPEDARWSNVVGQLQTFGASEVWRARLAPKDIATIERVQEPTLRRRGYVV